MSNATTTNAIFARAIAMGQSKPMTATEVLAWFVRLHDAGVRPQPVRGMLREEREWHDAIQEARTLTQES